MKLADSEEGVSTGLQYHSKSMK